MDQKEILRRLKNLRKKWRAEATRQGKHSKEYADRNLMTAAEKSMGIWIGNTGCAKDLDKLIKELEGVAKGV